MNQNKHAVLYDWEHSNKSTRARTYVHLLSLNRNNHFQFINIPYYLSIVLFKNFTAQTHTYTHTCLHINVCASLHTNARTQIYMPSKPIYKYHKHENKFSIKITTRNSISHAWNKKGPVPWKRFSEKCCLLVTSIYRKINWRLLDAWKRHFVGSRLETQITRIN